MKDEEGPAHPSRNRVLVVEDNRDTAETLDELLQMWGHEVRTAFSGSEALACADEFRPDVVLLDIGLPGMDGYEVAQHLRSRAGSSDAIPDTRYPTPTLIALTGYGQDGDYRRSAQAGVDYHLTKPVDPVALRRLLVAVTRS